MTTSAAVSGNFFVTHRVILSIALPTMLAWLSIPLLGLVDTGVVGRLGDAALIGGLAVGAIIFDLLFSTFNFLRASTTALVAQAMGANDEHEQYNTCLRSMFIAIVSSLLVLTFAPAILFVSLQFMSVPPAVADAMTTYFIIRILGSPFTLLNYALLGWFLGRAHAMTALLLQTFQGGMNIALSIWFGLGLGWGLEGVAWATVTSECFAFLLAFFLFSLRLFPFRRRLIWRDILTRSALLRLMGVNIDIMIRSFCLLAGFAFFTSQGAVFGENTLAANAILLNFLMLAAYLLDGFATAAEQLVGRSLGAGNADSLRRAIRLTLLWSFLLGSLIFLSFHFFGSFLVDLLTDLTPVSSLAKEYLIWASLSALTGVLAFHMDGVYIGATWSREMRNMMILSLLGYILVWLLIRDYFGNSGLWFSLHLFFIFRGLSLLFILPSRIRRSFPAGLASSPTPSPTL